MARYVCVSHNVAAYKQVFYSATAESENLGMQTRTEKEESCNPEEKSCQVFGMLSTGKGLSALT